MSEKKGPSVLVILDGWGYSEDDDHNAIINADTPVWDRLWNEHPHTLIKCSSSAVGLPTGQMGNSEVGHLNLGAGRVVYQEFTRVSRSIKTGSFFSNRTLTDAVDLAVDNGKAVHIIGLLSPGGVHSHEEHIHAMVKLAAWRGAEKLYVHAFLDGRDMPPRSAEPSLRKLEEVFDELGKGRIASLIGRYYAMDRDHNWERVRQAYNLMTGGATDYYAADAVTGLHQAYERGESDEFVKATCITPVGMEPAKVEDGDVIINMNYRSDRARELTRAFINDKFDSFNRAIHPKLASYVSLTEYHKDFDINIAFPAERFDNVFGAYVSNLGLHQLRVAETEKYAHVTFFFNGGIEIPFEGEERVLVPSPKVATYDLKPEMSAHEVTDVLVDGILNGKYETIICNFANGDMVGHTGNYEAAIKAVEVLDHCLGRVVEAIQSVKGELLITADHGNAEQMANHETGQAHTAHTSNPVPLVYVGEREIKLAENGALGDIAPTLLATMDLAPPREMTGRSLLIDLKATQAA